MIQLDPNATGKLVEQPRYVMHDGSDDPVTKRDGSRDAVCRVHPRTIVDPGARRLELACDENAPLEPIPGSRT